MNPLLAQFLAEAADLLTRVDDGLLRLERDPGDAELLNEVFRAAHTIKGSSGLFEFGELTRLTHAAEDLLDAVRGGRLTLDAVLTDQLLAAFDLVRGWLAHVTGTGRLPDTAAGEAAGVIEGLRAPLGGSAGPAPTGAVRAAGAPAGGVSTDARSAPDWVGGCGAEWLAETASWLTTTSATMRFARYTPDRDCFFRGEDPLHLLRQVPALERLVALPGPAEEDYDDYACLLGFALATRAGEGELAHLFRYVPEQVEVMELDGPALRRLLDGVPATGAQPAAAPPDQPDDQPTAAPGVGRGDVLDILDAAERAVTALPESEPERGHRLASINSSVQAAACALGQVFRPADDATQLTGALRRLLDRARAERATGLADPEGARRAGTADPAGAADPAGTADPSGAAGASTPGGYDGPRRRASDFVDVDHHGQVGNRTLKVDQGKIDRLMELVGELNVAKNGLTFLAEAADEEFGNRLLARRIKDQYGGMHRIAEELQSAVMDVRLLPLSVAFARFPRLVRDLSRKLGRPAELVTEGGDTMADKDVIEALGDPLVHLVRNALDHGIEEPPARAAAGKAARAEIRLSAFSDGDAIVVEVSDDGAGVDPVTVGRKAYQKGLITEEQLAALDDEEAVDLIFLPGFSTAEAVSDLSGRGVGMDAVRVAVEALGGTVTLRSRPGAGTVARLRLPQSVAVAQVMVVGVAGQRFGIPVDAVAETVRVSATDLDRVLHQDVICLRGDVVPVLDLAQALGMRRDTADAPRNLLVARVGGHQVGLLVDRFDREVDVMIKPMEGLLAGHPAFSGTALLGDGLVLLVLNLREVLHRAATPA